MPRKTSRADLWFLAAEPSSPLLRHLWRGCGVRRDGRKPWPAVGILGRAGRSLAEEVVCALEEGSLLHLEEIERLPDEYNLVLFEEGSYEIPASIVVGEAIDAYRDAVLQLTPLPFEGGEVLFGTFYWKLSHGETLLDDEHLRLELLDALDAERRRYERLKRQYGGAERQVAARRERIPEEIRIFVWRRDEGRCVRCGSQESLEFDHIIPVSKGGANSARNLQLLCERCNREKGAEVA
jgi:hypothetical protein